MENTDSVSVFDTPEFRASWLEECRQIADGTAAPVPIRECQVSSVYNESSLTTAATAILKGCSVAVAAHNIGRSADSLHQQIWRCGGRDAFLKKYAVL